MFRDRDRCLACRGGRRHRRAAGHDRRPPSSGLLARAGLAAAAGRSQRHAQPAHPAAREVLPGHAAQLSDLRACPVRCQPADRVHDLPGRQRLCGQQRPRAGRPGQSDCPAGRSADDRDVPGSRRDAGAFRSGPESVQAYLRVRFAHAAVCEFPDRGAHPRRRQDLPPLEGSRTIMGSPGSAQAASARLSPPGIVRISSAA